VWLQKLLRLVLSGFFVFQESAWRVYRQ